MLPRTFYVYIMTNKSRTLYTGMTNDLFRRVTEHTEKQIPGFTSKLNINQPFNYEEYTDSCYAIKQEKRISNILARLLQKAVW